MWGEKLLPDDEVMEATVIEITIRTATEDIKIQGTEIKTCIR